MAATRSTSIWRIITDDEPAHQGPAPRSPGELLREDILPAVARPKTEIARLLGISRQTRYDILNEKQPVTPAMALRLARMFGGTAESWVNMQRNYFSG